MMVLGIGFLDQRFELHIGGRLWYCLASYGRHTIDSVIPGGIQMRLINRLILGAVGLGLFACAERM